MNILDQLKSLQCEGSGKFVVYTAIIDAYDELYDPPEGDEGIDYVCFTDNMNLSSDRWLIVQVPFRYRDPRRLSKLFKLFPHLLFPNYAFSVWIDGSLRPRSSLNELIADYCLNSDMTVFSHPKRICLYDEAKICLRLGKESPSVVNHQLQRYRAEGFPEDCGLIAGTFLVRKHNVKRVQSLMEDWWQEVDQFSVRDQLSFNYVAWAANFRYSTLPFKLTDNKFFLWSNHSKSKFYDMRGDRKFSFRLILFNLYNRISTRLCSNRDRNAKDA